MKDFNVKVGEAVRRLRESKDESQEDLGRVVGKKGGAVSRCELGHSAFSAEDLLKISKHYNVRIGEIVGEKRDDGISEEEMRVVRFYRPLPSEDKKEVIFLLAQLNAKK